MRLLWWLRQARPWNRLGENRTVFDLAEDPRRALKRLEQCPEVLVALETAPPICLGTRGVWLDGRWITELPESVEVITRAGAEGGYQLVVGAQRFRLRESPEDVARVLEKTLRYYYRDFLPQVPSALRWRSPGALASLSALNGLKCPECHRRVLPCTGEVAVPLEDPDEVVRKPA
jgi:hypothetical protein